MFQTEHFHGSCSIAGTISRGGGNLEEPSLERDKVAQVIRFEQRELESAPFGERDLALGLLVVARVAGETEELDVVVPIAAAPAIAPPVRRRIASIDSGGCSPTWIPGRTSAER
jgi:hypothetical protein